MSYTNRARVLLVLLPLLVPLSFLFNLGCAILTGALRGIEVFSKFTADDIHKLYWNIYRPARYGHVLDYPEDKRQ